MVVELTLSAITKSPRSTFPDVLDHWATQTPDRRAYLFLGDGETEEASYTFSELRRAVQIVARGLAERVKPGDRVLLFYPAGLDFIVAFLGCLRAGLIAVPVSVPNRKPGLEIVAGIAADAGAACLLSTAALLQRYRDDLENDPRLRGLSRVDTTAWETDVEGGPEARLADGCLEAPALLQYTSGSTGAPRGVVVTHSNLADNHAQLQHCFQHDQSTVVVSWLPMFHDMGLGTVLQALWVGGQAILMSPSAFLQKPIRWLRAISRYRGTFSGGPDFAFDLCVRRVGPEERNSLDLSAWRCAYNGSEPVRAGTLVRFWETFASAGFSWENFHAVYGLAEATLFVTGEAIHQPPMIRFFSRSGLVRGQALLETADKGQRLVGCGHPWLEGRVLIVDPETFEECAPGKIGEIWLAGPSVAAGYWGKEADTRSTFQAHTSTGGGPYLRTGDLGFVHEHGLFVTGRSKDLVIVRGVNHYPQDIEETVSDCHPALEPQRCAAFSVDTEDGESLVVAQEVKRTALRSVDAEAVFRAIRKAVADRHGLNAAAILLLRPLALPRTTSGKVRRKACRVGFLNQSLAVVATSGLGASQLQIAESGREAPMPAAKADRLVQWLRQPGLPWDAGDSDFSQVTPDILSALAAQGLLGLQIGADQGGLGLSDADTLQVLEQLGGVNLGAAIFVGLNNYLGVRPLAYHGQLSLQRNLLPRLAKGDCLAGFALAEVGANAGPSSWSSRMIANNGSGWKLLGKKYLAGGMRDAGLFNVFVRHEDRSAVSGFIVSRTADGVRSSTHVGDDGILREMIELKGVAVDPSHVLGRLGNGMEIALDAIRHAQLAVAAACLGAMKRCSQLIFQHAAQRQSGESGLIAHPVTMTRLGRITVEVTALESLIQFLSLRANVHPDLAAEAFGVCKLVGPEMLWQGVDDLVQLLGRRGIVETPQVRRLVNDARVLRGLEGPTEAGAARLGFGLMSGDRGSLRRLVSEGFGTKELESVVEDAANALRMGALSLSGRLTPGGGHWLQARSGELTTWVILLGAVRHRLLETAAADLQRTEAWIRSNLENVLATTRGGPPPDAQMGEEPVGSAIASYERAIGGVSTSLDTSTTPASEGWSNAIPQGSLKSWAVSWLAQRLRLEESSIDTKRSLADHGVDSLVAVEFANALAEKLGLRVDEMILWAFSTIDELLAYVTGGRPSAPAREETS
jgi:acyl-CoA synthetase (AMP-forming)/AMP-acid ligase II/alkylation response protein AidB-like acyl-CoA dehydrogenase/acyl carrier protein